MKISVIIPTYNRYETLKRALRSVFAQTYKPEEVIVVDDGSDDDTYKIKEDFPSIIYHFQNNAGVSAARNKGIKLSRYEWIAFLDSDDEYHKDKLALHVKLHKQYQNLKFSYTNELWIRNQVRINIPKKFQKYSGMIFDKCLTHCIIAPSSVLIHRDIFDDIGLFDESLEVCEDYDLWLRLTCKYEAGLVDIAVTIKHGGHPDQLSKKHWGMDRFRVKSLEKFLGKDERVRGVLRDKYNILLKGAKKYNKTNECQEYEKKLANL